MVLWRHAETLSQVEALPPYWEEQSLGSFMMGPYWSTVAEVNPDRLATAPSGDVKAPSGPYRCCPSALVGWGGVGGVEGWGNPGVASPKRCGSLCVSWGGREINPLAQVVGSLVCAGREGGRRGGGEGGFQEIQLGGV